MQLSLFEFNLTFEPNEDQGILSVMFQKARDLEQSLIEAFQCAIRPGLSA